MLVAESFLGAPISNVTCRFEFLKFVAQFDQLELHFNTLHCSDISLTVGHDSESSSVVTLLLPQLEIRRTRPC